MCVCVASVWHTPHRFALRLMCGCRNVVGVRGAGPGHHRRRHPMDEIYTVGDIVITTDSSGYGKLMLITMAGPVTTTHDGVLATRHCYTGPLFDSWLTANTPLGERHFPAIQGTPQTWVSRSAVEITGKLAWADNPMNHDFWS